MKAWKADGLVAPGEVLRTRGFVIERRKLAYSNFTLSELEDRFQLRLSQVSNLFGAVEEVDLPPDLERMLNRFLPVALNVNTEKARSESIIAPMLMEFCLLHQERLSYFSGIEFNVDEAKGLNGRCDYILSQSTQRLEVRAPICVLVEAKNENMNAGIPQCLAEMIAAQQFNLRKGNDRPVYGIVSNGELWQFLKLDGLNAYIDRVHYPIQIPKKIFGILTAIALN